MGSITILEHMYGPINMVMARALELVSLIPMNAWTISPHIVYVKT